MEYDTSTSTGEPVKIIKEKDDPFAYRVSMGGRPNIGFYITFRGDVTQVAKMMDELNNAFQEAAIKFIAQQN